ncbi:hypothetical protein SUGI_1066460 [Cryptomeria japonica]|uniref:GDSL esterase/lipase At2g04570 n=1 Tax=Cryptomeria japonica TaxID=3369 RepID=UPI002414CF8F|nr:GDSL esterase/lipase At2g04570 [Cryptomeria japonica]GLJ50124.1 hypothetical protein SUGI_1066460 [Cryptomeria japonica]
MGYTKPCGLISFLACILVLVCGEKDIERGTASSDVDGNAKVSALFTLGDSIVDPGNNNFLPTIAKANHPPYGQDFIDKRPTGRFSNGKLTTDFVAAALGLKDTLPGYLEPDLSIQDFLTGLSFASSATGYDNLTAINFNVIPMWKQMEFLKEYKAHLEDMVGKEKSINIIEEALFLMVAGTNDFIYNYFSFPIRKHELSVEQYQNFLLDISSNLIQDLYNVGARKVGVTGLPPLGCLPMVRDNQRNSVESACIEEFNQIAISYNKKLKENMETLQARLPGITLGYLDIYDSLLDIITYPTKYGFESSTRGCCGTGSTELAFSCNVVTPITCADASKFVFWDALHPTQKASEILANVLIEQYIKFL